MGERLLCKQEVIGSIPFTSTWPVHLHLVRGQKTEDGSLSRRSSVILRNGIWRRPRLVPRVAGRGRFAITAAGPGANFSGSGVD